MSFKGGGVMNKQELLMNFEKQTTDQEFRQIVSAIMQKLCSFSIHFLIFPQQKIASLDLDTELSQLKQIIKLPDLDTKLLLRAITEFYFSNVEKAWKP